MLYKIIKAKVSLKLTFLLFSFISLVFQTIGQEIEIDRKSYENTKDKLPSFPGGDTALVNYINKNLLIPIKVINKGTQGTVLLEFIVTENGDIMEIEVVKDIGDNCGEIAKKLVENMPKWEPAVHNKKPIVAPYVLAIDFNMNSHETSMKNNEAPKKNKNRKFQEIFILDSHSSGEKIAILPPRFTIRDRRLFKKKKKDANKIVLQELETELQQKTQQFIYDLLSEVRQKNQLSIDVQDIAFTNKLLLNNDIIDAGNLNNSQFNNIANELEVDYLLNCNIGIERILSEGGSIALSLFYYGPDNQGNLSKTSTHKYGITFEIYDKNDDAAIWREAIEIHNEINFQEAMSVIENAVEIKLIHVY